MKHTPGPWVVKKTTELDSRERLYLVQDTDKWDVCALHGNYDGQEATARLIAAAPDLLAAAKAMFEEGAHGFDMLRAAIAKAEGNTEGRS